MKFEEQGCRHQPAARQHLRLRVTSPAGKAAKGLRDGRQPSTRWKTEDGRQDASTATRGRRHGRRQQRRQIVAASKASGKTNRHGVSWFASYVAGLGLLGFRLMKLACLLAVTIYWLNFGGPGAVTSVALPNRRPLLGCDMEPNFTRVIWSQTSPEFLLG